MDYKLLLIDSPHFCAGICLDKDNTVLAAAPMVDYMSGWSLSKVQNYCSKKKWKLKENIPFNKADKLDESIGINNYREEMYPFVED